MPKTSWFSFADMLELSSRQPPGLHFFETSKSAQGQAFKDGGVQESELFADAVVVGVLIAACESIEAQLDPLQATWGLAPLEKAYQVFPEPSDSIQERQDELALWMTLPRNSTTVDIDTWIREYIGADFVGLWKPAQADVTNYPSNYLDQPMLIRPVDAPRKTFKLLDDVLDTVGQSVIRYEPVAPRYTTVLDDDALDPALLLPEMKLVPGDEFVLDCGDLTRCERVTVEDVGFHVIGSQQWRTLSVTFAQVHKAGTVGTTYGFPYWTTNAQLIAIVVKPAILSNARKMRGLHRFLHSALRHDTTWAIVEESAAGEAGPFKVNEGKIGFTPIGTLVV